MGKGRPWEECVLYEVHLGTFTPHGTFLGTIERLDWLVTLALPPSKSCRWQTFRESVTGAMTVFCCLLLTPVTVGLRNSRP
jgi:hypothetical protein